MRYHSSHVDALRRQLNEERRPSGGALRSWSRNPAPGAFIPPSDELGRSCTHGSDLPPSWIDRKRFSDEEPERAGGEYPLIRMTSFGERRRSDMRIVNRAMPRNGACPIGARVKWGKGQRPFRIFRKVRKNFTIIFYDAPGTPKTVKPAAPCADVAASPFPAALSPARRLF